MSYPEIAKDARKKVLKMIFDAQSSHIGSNFSAIDILTVLFEKVDLGKDELVVSKGWIAASVYYFLARKGVIAYEDLDRYCKDGEEDYIGLIEPRGKFALKAAGGSMGFGLPFGAGFALAKKLKKESGTVYVLMSDGEQAIGTTWESALIAAHHKLGNLVVIIDNNGFQAMGKTDEVLRLGGLGSKWEALGFDVWNIDGHDHSVIDGSLSIPSDNPKVLICNTVKGKGVSFMEGDNKWHYLHVDQEDYDKALFELNHS